MFKKLLTMRWTVLFSMLLGVFVTNLFGYAPMWIGPLYDRIYPVVEMKGVIKSKSPGEVVIHMTGRKNRACQYLGLQGFALMPGGTLNDANAMRVDTPSEGKSKPVGNFDIGFWRVWPTTGAIEVSVYTSHNCDGRIVVTQIAKVAL